MDTILVIIPAYEDPLLIQTLDSLFDKANKPERITVAVGLQYREKPRGWGQRKGQDIKYIIYDADNHPGVNRIRKELLKFFNHDYLLMIDSHADFADSWDTTIINHYKMLQSLHGNKVILSKPCSDLTGDLFEQDNKYNEEGVVWELRDEGSLWLDLFPFYGPRTLSDGLLFYWSGYMCCHFAFIDRHWVEEVGISEVNQAYCEEPLLSYSSYAAGWDVYAMPSYNHVAHLDKPYNKSVYGNEDVARKDKRFGDDTLETIREVNNYLLNGIGARFVKPKTNRMPEDFFDAIGLHQEELWTLRQRYQS